MTAIALGGAEGSFWPPARLHLRFEQAKLLVEQRYLGIILLGDGEADASRQLSDGVLGICDGIGFAVDHGSGITGKRGQQPQLEWSDSSWPGVQQA